MTAQRPVRTLIVGEHLSIAKMLTGVLDDLNVGPIERASNGVTALTMMREEFYGLVISDWSMEPVSGLQLLKFVRAEPSLSEARFVISVPTSDETGQLASNEAGATGILTEPYSLDSLRCALRE